MRRAVLRGVGQEEEPSPWQELDSTPYLQALCQLEAHTWLLGPSSSVPLHPFSPPTL